jgi:hypothetical protein
MTDLSWLNQALPILGFAMIVFISYAVIAKTKILGESTWINIIVSLIIGAIFITFSSIREYLLNITPLFVLLVVIAFMFLITIYFIAKNPDNFTKPLAIIFIIFLALLLIGALFYTFPTTRAVLPFNDDYENNYCDYDKKCTYENCNYDLFDHEECYKKDGKWKCYNGGYYKKFDKCLTKGDEYKCYDYDDCEKECNYDCDYDNHNREHHYNDSDNVFENFRNWFYREKILNAFWLLVVAAIAIFVVTRS